MSIFKASFKPYVQKQLNARQDLVKQDVRDSRLSQYVSGKTAWTRMTSFVSVNGNADLSKQYILESGTLFPNGQGKYALKSGINKPGASYNSITQDGFKMGLRPMPGIISVEIHNKSAYGALREATVKYIVHTKKELEELEILFMRPGHHVMLEWGWSMFLDTTAQSTANRLPIDTVKMKNFLEPTINAFKEELIHFDVINQMEVLRQKFSGNYDGMVGPIRNFEFRLLDNGSYECTTVIISLGDILDSLKISSTGLPVDDGKQTDQKRLATKFESIFQPLLSLSTDYLANVVIGAALYDKNLKDKKNADSIDNVDFRLIQLGFRDIPNLKGKESGGLHYMSIGAFTLAMSAQFNLFDPRKVGPGPIIDIELPYPGYGTYGNGLCLASKDTVSIDPTVCIIKNTKATFITGNPKGYNISDKVELRDFHYGDTTNLGIIGNIYVCIEHMIDRFKTLAEQSHGYVDLKQYMITILKDCSYALGGLNEFDMFATDASVAILDIHYVETDSQRRSKYQMNILGTDSVIKNFNISSKIFASQATMIAIAAQDRENIAGVQSSSYNYLNRGLSDRLVLQKLDKDAVDAQKASAADSIAKQDKEYKKQLAQTLINIRTYLSSFINQDVLKRDLSQVPANRGAAQSNLNSIILKINKDANYKAVIPICVEVTIDGISGLTQGEIFTINPDALPREYVGSHLGFIITDLKSSIVNSTWNTTLSTQCCILDQDGIVAFSEQAEKDRKEIEAAAIDFQSEEKNRMIETQNNDDLEQVYIYNMLIRIIVSFFGAINANAIKTINDNLSANNIFQPGLAKTVPLFTRDSFIYQYDINFTSVVSTYDLLTHMVKEKSDYNKLKEPLKTKFDTAYRGVKTALVDNALIDQSPLAVLVLVYQNGNNVRDYQKLFINTRAFLDVLS